MVATTVAVPSQRDEAESTARVSQGMMEGSVREGESDEETSPRAALHPKKHSSGGVGDAESREERLRDIRGGTKGREEAAYGQLSGSELRQIVERAQRIESLLRDSLRGGESLAARSATPSDLASRLWRRPEEGVEAELEAAPEDGTLQVAEESLLPPRVAIRLAFVRRVISSLGMLVGEEDDEEAAHPSHGRGKIRVSVADRFPAPVDPKKSFRGKYWFDIESSALYVRPRVLDQAGEVLLDVCHVLACIQLHPSDIRRAQADPRTPEQAERNLQCAGSALFLEFARASMSSDASGTLGEPSRRRSGAASGSLGVARSSRVSLTSAQDAAFSTQVRGDPTLYTPGKLSERLRTYQAAVRPQLQRRRSSAREAGPR